MRPASQADKRCWLVSYQCPMKKPAGTSLDYRPQHALVGIYSLGLRWKVPASKKVLQVFVKAMKQVMQLHAAAPVLLTVCRKLPALMDSFSVLCMGCM